MEQGSKSGKPLTGRFELLHPSKYVKAADLGDRDVTVIIAGIFEEHLVMQGGKRERKPALVLRSKRGVTLGKKFVLNKTNAKLIAAVTGEKSVERWAGHEITIYATTCKGAQGGMVDCVRVRARVDRREDAGEVPEDMAVEPEAQAFADEADGDNERQPGEDG